jgi:THO complex subunit 2
MASGADSARSKADQNSGRERSRDTLHKSSGPSNNPQLMQQDSGLKGAGSLRSRIGEKEIPSSALLSSPIPYRSDPSRSEDDRDGGRKRTASGITNSST